MTDDDEPPTTPVYSRPNTHYHRCNCGHFWLCKRPCDVPELEALRNRLPGLCTACKKKAVTMEEVA